MYFDMAPNNSLFLSPASSNECPLKMAWNHSEKVVSGSFWYKKTKSYLFEANYKGHFYFK